MTHTLPIRLHCRLLRIADRSLYRRDGGERCLDRRVRNAHHAQRARPVSLVLNRVRYGQSHKQRYI